MEMQLIILKIIGKSIGSCAVLDQQTRQLLFAHANYAANE